MCKTAPYLGYIPTKGEFVISSIDCLNQFAALIKDIGKNQLTYFEKLMEYTDPRNEIGLKALTEHYYEFELFDRIKDAEHVECCSLLVLKE